MDGLINYQSVLQLAAGLNVGASAVMSIIGDSFRREERIVHLLHDSADVIEARARELGGWGEPILADIAALRARIAGLERAQGDQESRTGNTLVHARYLFAGLSIASVVLLIVSSWPIGGVAMLASYLSVGLLVPIVVLSIWTAVRPDWLSAHLKGPRETVSIDLAELGARIRTARSDMAAAGGR